MKKRICFAGFAGEELASLQAASSTANSIWECVFAPDAAAAQAVLSQGACDALVASFSSGSHAGLDLLHEVAAQHPRALRFIVGNVGDQALLLEGIGGTHQFINRPVAPAELIATLQRGLALDAWLASDELRKLAPRLRRLPSLPSTYFELLKQLESSAFSLQSINEIIARDPAVTARLLQMVNSSAFALAQKITDPADAVALLGIETVKSLVLCLQVFSPSEDAQRAGVVPEDLWVHSFTVANFARQITASETGNVRLANDAFTAGLLHDVGRIVLAANLPAEYGAVVRAARDSGRPLHEIEAAQLGATHAQVGAYLLGLWGMPAPLVEAAAAHHTPSQTHAHEFSLLAAVHAANVFARAQEAKRDGLALPEIDAAYFAAIGLADRPALWQRLLQGEPPKTSVTSSAKPAAAPASVTVVKETSSNWLVRYFMPATAAAVLLVFLTFWFSRGHKEAPVQLAKNKVETKSSAPIVQPPVAPVAKTEAPPAPRIPAAPVITEKAETPKAEAPPAAPAPTPPPPAMASANGFDAVKVQGVFYRTARPLVLINGKTLQVGDRIQEVAIVAIEPSKVTLAWAGEQREIRVK